ncbi:MAG: four helix bundle protein [Chitinophagaceae bacterium]|nr:four helix bundle protein [Chitinophagaceae bacterium]
MPLGSFEESDVWKEARQLKKAIRALTNTFPPEEKYRLTDQIIRSSRSVGAQIAEGHGRKTNADESRYCIIARGSLSETINHLIDAFDEDYITEDTLNEFRNQVTKVEKL